MDSVLLGDNQFFGINHMSEEKARAQAIQFQSLDAMLKVIDTAYACGLRGFMFSAHDRVADLCDRFRAQPSRYGDLRVYPVLPYAHKYANAVAEKGILGTLKDAAAGNIMGTAARGSWAIATQDVLGVMRILVDAEMRMFRSLNVPVVFLQNIVTDLLLGLRQRDLFVAFAAYIRKRYAAEPAFITMNLPSLVAFLLECGIENPIVCSSINRIGYLMNPSREACEETILRQPFRPVAMSIFASGAVPAQEAVDYVFGLQRIQSIVFGASSRGHIEQTKSLIEQRAKLGGGKRAAATPSDAPPAQKGGEEAAAGGRGRCKPSLLATLTGCMRSSRFPGPKTPGNP